VPATFAADYGRLAWRMQEITSKITALLVSSRHEVTLNLQQ
jgi:hypothetical protein